MSEQNATLPLDTAHSGQLAAQTLPFAPESTRGGMGGVVCASLTPAASATAARAAVDSVAWRHEGALRMSVVVKASFSIESSPMTPAETVEPIHAKDVHHRRGPMTHVTAASDRVPYRQYVDVTALGHACAPGGRPVAEMTARFALVQRGAPGVDWTVRVVGRRRKAGDAPEPFARLPITYERAAGGLDAPDNPVGCGEDDDELPNVLDPSDPRRPAGFGPIAAVWPARSRRLAAAARAGLDAQVMEVPGGVDWSYFQCAPREQWVSALQGDAAVVLEGFHAERPRIQSALPDARVAGAVYGLDDTDPDAPRRLAFHADGLHVDADRLLCTITWRAHVDLRDLAQRERLMVVAGVGIGSAPAVPPRRPPRPSPAAAARSRPGEQRPAAGAGGTLAIDEARAPASASSPLPLAAAPSPLAAAPSLPVVAPSLPAAAPSLPAAAPVPLAAAPSPLAPAPSPAAPAPAAAPPEEPVPIERYAAVASELADRGALRSKVLSAHHLDEPTFRKAERRWRDALERELKRGERALRERFDDAYVSAWERRHPDRFGVAQYARLLGAERRGTLTLEIADQGLDASLGMRLKRVWQRRVASRAALAEQVERAVASR
ncbi:DUF2169 family type VI secretion system accessory protein [Sorangium sp. So ce1078]|uniref:DUF2169 family type VI secretion system accessory protein n=1 Tax=Sorangium sp. So ce1078 TaxID=3133329 RepID=UPI003F5DCEAB